jgi:hypothetical protein
MTGSRLSDVIKSQATEAMNPTVADFWSLMQRWKIPDADALELIEFPGKIGKSAGGHGSGSSQSKNAWCHTSWRLTRRSMRRGTMLAGYGGRLAWRSAAGHPWST